MSANILNSADEQSDAVAFDFRIVVFIVPDDLEALAQILMKLPHMDRVHLRFTCKLRDLFTLAYGQCRLLEMISSQGVGIESIEE